MLEYFHSLDRKLDATRLAYTAQLESINAAITAETATLHTRQRARQDTAKVLATIRKLKQERANLSAPSYVSPLADVERYARTHPRAELLPPVNVKIPNGQTPLAVHNNAAEMTNRILAEISRTERAPLNDPSTIDAQVDALAKPARIVNGQVVLPQHVVLGHGGMSVTTTDVAGLLIWLARDEFVKALQKAAKPGITRAERDAALKALHEKFAAALRVETAAAMLAEKAEQTVIRRRHVHPAVLLNAKVDPGEVYRWFAERKGA